jgi:hypothetical protein
MAIYVLLKNRQYIRKMISVRLLIISLVCFSYICRLQSVGQSEREGEEKMVYDYVCVQSDSVYIISFSCHSRFSRTCIGGSCMFETVQS